MVRQTGTTAPKGKRGASPIRRARGFAQAGGLIGGQLGTLAARRGFAQARLMALWPEIAGPETAAICRPVGLAPARGPAGPVLTLAVSGAHAPQIQMLLPALRERVNAALGPASVGRIALVQGLPPDAPPAPAPAPVPVPVADLGPLRAPLSSIGDDDLRRALETLARNVLSRARNPQQPER